MQHYICPRCMVSREAVTKEVTDKKGKCWVIEYCYRCEFNFNLYEKKEYVDKEELDARAKRKARRFKWGFPDDPDYAD